MQSVLMSKQMVQYLLLRAGRSYAASYSENPAVSTVFWWVKETLAETR
jgi:hypothetical protein